MAARGPTNDYVTDIPSYQISFDVEAFDEAVATQGVKLVHYAAMRCPVGMVDIGDNQRPHPDHEGCTNGFIYTRVGTVTALYTGNSKQKKSDDIGYWDGSTAQVTFRRFYDSCEDGCPEGQQHRVYVAPFDRFYLNESGIVVPTWQLFLHSESGRDRLRYPVVAVQHLVDARGERFTDADFTVSGSGLLAWTGTRQPAPEVDTGPGVTPGVGSDRGAVCSIRYLYRPYWYVGQVLHEIRVSQVSGASGRGVERMPQSVMLHREYVGQTREQHEPGQPGPNADVMRTVLGSLSGGMGSR